MVFDKLKARARRVLKPGARNTGIHTAPLPRSRSFDLPAFKLPAASGGRSVREGYQRGWGIQYGDIAEKIERETLFREAAAAGAASLMTREKRLNMYLLLTHFLDKLSSQNIVEFGTYRGGNALFMATVLKELYPQARVYALDTFEGMPPVDKERDLHSAGDFNDALLPQFRERIEKLRLDNLVIVQGLFNETFPSLKGVEFGLAHIDCDIYPAVMYCQDAVWPQMAKGGYVVYDDADVSSCIGATEAVENLIMERRIHTEQVWPHWIVRTGLGDEPKAAQVEPKAEQAAPPPAQEPRTHADRIEAEIATFRDTINIHDLPAIFHHWSCTHLAGIVSEVFGIWDMYEVFARELRASIERTGNPLIVSVGAGDGTVEAAVAAKMLEAGFTNFRFSCLELSPHLIERGEALIAERGLSGHMSFDRADLTEWAPREQFGAAFAHHSLHHIVALEHVFECIHTFLEPEGAFVTADMIGRNGHMRWPETLAIIEGLWATMPERYKYHHLFGRQLEAYENWDCSGEGFEGIRAQDILPLLVKRFTFEKFCAWGSLTDIFVDRAFGHNFDDKNKDDVAFIDELAKREAALLRTGQIKPTQMLAVMRKTPVKLKASKGLTPAGSIRRPD